jgi:hypothetical protein
VRRGGERGVKGLDRFSGGEAALDAARASAMLHLRGMSAGFVQWITRSQTNFASIKLKKRLRQLFLKNTSCALVHFCAP